MFCPQQLQLSIKITLATSEVSQIIAPVLCLCKSLPLLQSLLGRKRTSPDSYCSWGQNIFVTLLVCERQQIDFIHYWRNCLGVPVLRMLKRQDFLGGDIQWYCYIPFHPLQVKMQYCSLEGNYFPFTVLNFSSGLACLTYKKLELGRKRENSERRESMGKNNLSFVFIWAELNYSVNSLSLAAALKTCPSSWGEQELTHPSTFAAQAWTWLLVRELCPGSGSSPHTSTSSLPAGLLLLPQHPGSAKEGQTDTLHRRLWERLPAPGLLCE